MPKATGTVSYGYQHNAKALPQLYLALNIDAASEEAKTARNNLEELRRQYLDPNKTTGEQKDQICRIEAELIKRYPATYGGPQSAKKMYFAIRTLIYLHGIYRAKMKKKLSQSQGAMSPSDHHSDTIRSSESQKEAHSSWPTTPSFSSSSADSSSKENTSPIQIMSHSLSRQQLSTSNPAPRSKFRPVYKTPSTHPRTRTFISRGLGLATPCSSFDSSRAEDSAPSSSVSSLCPSTDPPQSQPISAGRGFTVVRSFLTSCRPSMEKYLHRFIDFGCKTEEHLSSMAAWDPERQAKVLKKILSGSDGTPLGNEMDIEIMQAQLETYYL